MAGSYHQEDVPARRPVTRSLVQSGLIFFISPASTGPSPAKKVKKVKFLEPNSAGHNSSVATDEGLDLSFSSLSSSINIPTSIVRPHHSLGQTWTFWFSGNNKRVSWTEDLVSIANIRTVEEFWTVHTKVCCSTLQSISRLRSIIISRSSPAVS